MQSSVEGLWETVFVVRWLPSNYKQGCTVNLFQPILIADTGLLLITDTNGTTDNCPRILKRRSVAVDAILVY